MWEHSLKICTQPPAYLTHHAPPHQKKKKKITAKEMISPGIEPGTSRDPHMRQCNQAGM
jgi:hypothetical protein